MNLSGFRKVVTILTLAMAAVVVVLGVVSWKRSGELGSAAIPVYGIVPPFSLTERSGRAIQLSDLRGQVWIVDFVFTTCPGPCPLMTSRMQRLQEEFKSKGDVRLVSVTVDPETDSPEVLSKYANDFHADANRWLFLTGPRKAIHALATDGLHLAMERNTNRALSPEGPIIHSTQFVLVDRLRRIRGYFDSTEEESLRRLIGDVNRLLGEKTS
jgi:protein SCO1/2